MVDRSGADILVNAWYQNARWPYLLWPLSMLYRCLVRIRRNLFRWGILTSWQSPVPVIVVGNISVGGTGKTPLVVALVKALQALGLRPAIISRGYSSNAPSYPLHVYPDSSAEHAGDEPLLLAIKTQVPVVIGADRVSAAQSLLSCHSCDVILSDDGLQHYALGRDIELLVLDGQRMFGNQMCLPAGPLRESVSRIGQCDFIVSNGEPSAPLITSVPSFTMALKATGFERVATGNKNDSAVGLLDWPYSKQVHAVAGIGNPGRFFNSLTALGFTVIEHRFSDHHQYKVEDLQFSDELPIMMTEKDAVKVQGLGQGSHLEKCWFVPVNAVIDKGLLALIGKRVKKLLGN
ncbi:MAG: tetraacyldisaccharide 4'-kinase [Spongiibacteraceae bacterium]|nr:tetraacyldisaccharide 4'-kinase [Spongiibacteraceae bacterium]